VKHADRTPVSHRNDIEAAEDAILCDGSAEAVIRG
jgi:hypothetical protein